MSVIVHLPGGARRTWDDNHTWLIKPCGVLVVEQRRGTRKIPITAYAPGAWLRVERVTVESLLPRVGAPASVRPPVGLQPAHPRRDDGPRLAGPQAVVQRPRAVTREQGRPFPLLPSEAPAAGVSLDGQQ